jgi:hypothetical protein
MQPAANGVAEGVDDIYWKAMSRAEWVWRVQRK